MDIESIVDLYFDDIYNFHNDVKDSCAHMGLLTMSTPTKFVQFLLNNLKEVEEPVVLPQTETNDFVFVQDSDIESD